MKYFEIYVGGRNGFSTYVKTEKIIPYTNTWDDTVLELAIAAKVIEPYDAKDIIAGNGYVEDLTKEVATYPDVTWNLI